jgi:dGTPase
LHAWVRDVVVTTSATGRVGLSPPMAEALAALRRFNHERIYLRPESKAQATSVIDMLRALVEHYVAHPRDLPASPELDGDRLHAAVAYVDGMTDRFACAQATALLDWPSERLPRGPDLA